MARLSCVRAGAVWYALAVFMLALAGPAHAAGHAARRVQAIEAVTVGHAGATVIAVKLADRARAHLLNTGRRLAAVALTDIDNDGDLDVVAASVREGLLLWRNAGGHFELVSRPAHGVGLRTGASLEQSAGSSTAQVLCDRVDAALPATRVTVLYGVAVLVPARLVRSAPFSVPSRYPSRAPPSVC